MKKGLSTIALIGALASASCTKEGVDTNNEALFNPGNTTAAEIAAKTQVEKKDKKGTKYNCREYLRTPEYMIRLKELRERTKKVIKCEPSPKKSGPCPVDVQLDENNKMIKDVWC